MLISCICLLFCVLTYGQLFLAMCLHCLMFYLVSLLVNVVLPVTVIVCPYHAPCSLVSIDVHQCHLHLCNYVFYVKLLVFVPQ